MSLRDRLAKLRGQEGADPSEHLYEVYGVRKNPFPPAGQPSGHPHLESSADHEIAKRINVFERDSTSQVMVVEGTQGVGKTNLLNYYQQELEELYRVTKGAYIIRYYPDPEPSFDGVLRKVIEELGARHFTALGVALAALSEEERNTLLAKTVRGHEMRDAFNALASAKDDALESAASAVVEWLTGARVLKRHTEAIRVKFRLDTVESKTQALRDVVDCSIELKQLRGIFLLLDELEKQDMTLSKSTVLRYLLAIRALIDALPRNFFLMIAITTEAKRRYFGMVPALQGRLATSIALKPLTTADEAIALYRFYLERAQEEAGGAGTSAGKAKILVESVLKKRFAEIHDQAAMRGAQGVSHREFLNALHDMAEAVFADAAPS